MTTTRDYPLRLKNENADCERGWGAYTVSGAVRTVHEFAAIVLWLEEQWGPSGGVNIAYWRYRLTNDATIKYRVTPEGITEEFEPSMFPKLHLYMRDEVRVSLLLVLDQF